MPHYVSVTSTPTNESAVYWSRDTDIVKWPLYCTFIGGSSCDVIRTYKLQLYLLKINKNYKIIIGENLSSIRFLWNIFVFRLVAYMLNMICLNLQFLYKIVYIWIFIWIWHSFISISWDRNIRYNFPESRSRAKVINFQPIPPFIFPLQSY